MRVIRVFGNSVAREACSKCLVCVHALDDPTCVRRDVCIMLHTPGYERVHVARRGLFPRDAGVEAKSALMFARVAFQIHRDLQGLTVKNPSGT